MNPPCPLLPLVNLLPCRFACRNKHIFILFPRCNAEFKPSGRISWGRPHLLPHQRCTTGKIKIR